MRNVFDKSCRENENTHFIFNNFFPKIAQFIMSKNVLETEGPHMTSQYGAYALRAGLARFAPKRMHTFTHPCTHMDARTRKHAHTNQYVILTAFLRQQWFRERASVLRNTYIACLVCCS